MSIVYHIWGEGPSDIGRVNPDGSREEEGCVDALLKRATPPRKRLKGERAGTFRDLKKLPGPPKKKLHRLKGFARNAYIATREALVDNADWLVLATDTDREAGKRRRLDAKKLCLRKREELKAGFEKALSDGQSEKPDAAPALIRVVPLRKLESWLLADERAFRKVTGRDRPKLPKKPEDLGGETDAKILLSEFGGSSKMFELAREASPDILRRECPVSYRPFFDDVQNAASSPPVST